MARGIPFTGATSVIKPPPGDEGTVAELALFRSRGGANVSCWELDAEELEEVARTGRVFASVYSGAIFYPIFVGSERTVHALVADTGPTFIRTPPEALPPSRQAIAFRISSEVLEKAHAIDGGLEVHVDGPSSVMVHVIAGDVEGVVPTAMPIAIDTVADAVKAVRAFLAEPDRATANTCGVLDELGELEVWLDAHGVDVDARCYPAPTPEAIAADEAFMRFLDGDEEAPR